MNATMVMWMAILCLGLALTGNAEGELDITVQETGSTVRVEAGGSLFTVYNPSAADRPFFYPVIGPGGGHMTRRWPMEQAEHEEHDHKHHRGLWFTHGDVNGQDFWEEGKGPRIVHTQFTELSSGKEGVIESENEWQTKDGTIVCTDTRRHVFRAGPGVRMIDFEITLHASHGDLVLGDTKEGSMAIRVPPTLRLKGAVAAGHIVNSEGDRDAEAWGKRASWCHYWGPIEGKTGGIAMFSHPENPGGMCWWHARDYGLFAANPFGARAFERSKDADGSLRVVRGEDLVLKYRVYMYEGGEQDADIPAHNAEYAGADVTKGGTETPISR